MKIIAVSGSPRKGGNTETLCRIALETIARHGIETELISLSGKTILPCTACMGCSRTHRCTVQDDFQEVFDSMVAADGIILATPVYYGSATANMTALMDRAGYVSYHNGNLFARKIGGPIAVARRAGQNFTFAQMLMWYMINGMIVPGSSYWNIAFGREPGDVTGDSEGVETMKNFAENLAWLAHKVV